MRAIIEKQIEGIDGNIKNGMINPEDINGPVFRICYEALTVVQKYYDNREIPENVYASIVLAKRFSESYIKSEPFPLRCFFAMGDVLDEWVDIELKTSSRHPAETDKYFKLILDAYRSVE